MSVCLYAGALFSYIEMHVGFDIISQKEMAISYGFLSD